MPSFVLLWYFLLYISWSKKDTKRGRKRRQEICLKKPYHSVKKNTAVSFFLINGHLIYFDTKGSIWHNISFNSLPALTTQTPWTKLPWYLHNFISFYCKRLSPTPLKHCFFFCDKTVCLNWFSLSLQWLTCRQWTKAWKIRPNSRNVFLPNQKASRCAGLHVIFGPNHCRKLARFCSLCS